MSNKVDLKNNQSNKKPKPADYLNIAICYVNLHNDF